MSRRRLVFGRAWGATALKLVLTRAGESAETTKVSASHHNTACKDVTDSNSACLYTPIRLHQIILGNHAWNSGSGCALKANSQRGVDERDKVDPSDRYMSEQRQQWQHRKDHRAADIQ